MLLYSSLFDAIRQGFFVGLIIQFLQPYREGSRARIIAMNALGVIRNALIYGVGAYWLDRFLARWW